MEKVFIENGFFSREANPKSPADCALLERYPGKTLIREELDPESEARTRLYMEEMEKASSIVSRPKAYEPALFNRYTSLHATLYVLTRWSQIRPIGPIGEELMPMVLALRDLREKLVPLRDPEEDIWYIWGENMPHSAIAETADWRMAFDTADFRPFLIPYMLDDQSSVKGNIVVISGGAYSWRSNRWEGYEAVRRFNELGYNCFLLQRRVIPYDPQDGAMDLQRSVRYLRAHAKEYGIAAADRIAVNGYSGGGMCICDMLSECPPLYGPELHYPDYLPDETDRQSAEVQAALLLYGVTSDTDQIERMKRNPSLPPLFLVVGQRDFAGFDSESAKLYLAVRSIVPSELHIFADTGHGFGVGPSEDVTFAYHPVEGLLKNVMVWPGLADQFLKVCFGLEKSFIPNEQRQ